jgi:hypothetical protein
MQDQIRSMMPPPTSSYLGTTSLAKQEESKLIQRPIHAEPIRESAREDVEEEVEKRVKERVEIERG